MIVFTGGVDPVLAKKPGSGALYLERREILKNSIECIFKFLKIPWFVFLLVVSHVPLMSKIQKTSLDPGPDWCPDPGLKGLQRTSDTKIMKATKNAFKNNQNILSIKF